MDCYECAVDRCYDCEAGGEEDHWPDDDGWYEVTCCCGRWGETRQTVEAVYAEMEAQLKPLQYPDAPQAGG